MPFYFVDLTPEVRELMAEEVFLDESTDSLYRGSYTNEMGKKEFPRLLVEAIRFGNEDTLASSLHRGLFNEISQVHKKDGTVISTSVPKDANQLLASGEFNRFYVRAICRLAIRNGIPAVRIYRARNSANPRPESEERIGKLIGAQALLNDLRHSQGVGSALGCPSGPRSGLSVMLPDSQVTLQGDQQAPA